MSVTPSWPRRRRLPLRVGRRPARARRRTASCWPTARRSPTRRRAGSRTACTVRPRRSTRRAFRGTTTAFIAPPLPTSSSTSSTSGPSPTAGTFDAAIEHLDELADLGINAIEPMPIAAFPGERNWGYDGVVPVRRPATATAARPAFQRFVDACHQRGLAVILDVVYNHLGPEGVVHSAVRPYFTDTYATPWGAAMNFSEAGSDEVRRYFIDNALMWLRDFHVDGLRFDAIHGIVDPTASPFLRELTAAIACARRPSSAGRFVTDRRERRQQPAGGLRRDGRRPRLRRPVERRLPPRAARRAHRRARRATTRTTARSSSLPRAFTHGFVFRGEYSRLPRSPARRLRAEHRRPTGWSCSRRTMTRSATGRVRSG